MTTAIREEQIESNGWITPAYAAGNFAASGAMTWDVGAPDVSTYAYTYDREHKTLTVSWYLLSTSVGGTPATALKIKIPGGFVAAKRCMGHHSYEDNAGPDTVAQAFTEAGSTWIELYKAGFGTIAWSLSTNLTTTYGQIVIEVQ